METDPIETNPAPAAPALPATPKSGLRRAAQIVSDVFSPLLAPTYCMAMAMWITPLQILPESTRMGATLGVAIITGAIPLACSCCCSASDASPICAYRAAASAPCP